MIDVTVKHFEELDSYQGQGVPKGQFAYAGRGLGVTAWGMNLLDLPASWPGYPDHDHAKDEDLLDETIHRIASHCALCPHR